MKPGRKTQHLIKINEPRLKETFLKEYANCGVVRYAAEKVGISRDLHYKWMNNDPVYAKAFEDACEEASDVMEKEARRRAIEGIDKPIYYEGERVDTVKEYSDTLLIFLMKGARPGKYREKWEVPPIVPPAVTNNVQVNITSLNADELANFIESTKRLLADPGAAGVHAPGRNGGTSPKEA
jgi:hypothetical protein